MMLWRERTLWIALTVTLGLSLGAAALWGWPWEAARHSAEWERGRALLFDQHTTYDSPIIPETPEESARRAMLVTGPVTKKLLDDLEAKVTFDGIDLENPRFQNYVSARLLFSAASYGLQSVLTDSRGAAFAYLAEAMRQGYEPAFELYNLEAEKDLEAATAAFKDGNKKMGWYLLLPLVFEDFPPAVNKMTEHSITLPSPEDKTYSAELCYQTVWYYASALNGNAESMATLSDLYLRPFQSTVGLNTRLAYAWMVLAHQTAPDEITVPDRTVFGITAEDAANIGAYVGSIEAPDMPPPVFKFYPGRQMLIRGPHTLRLERAHGNCYNFDLSSEAVTAPPPTSASRLY